MDRWLLNAERQREYDDCYLYDYSMFPPEDEEEEEEDDDTSWRYYKNKWL